MAKKSNQKIARALRPRMGIPDYATEEDLLAYLRASMALSTDDPHELSRVMASLRGSSEHSNLSLQTMAIAVMAATHVAHKEGARLPAGPEGEERVSPSDPGGDVSAAPPGS
ncbi:hypothetical protein ACFZC6_41940 [Streptomyces ossamyceticus]|uniref:hypothetical protein n=1 Tax=Streptomyces ossamyceticus TaxID=249581 RepID=UPI0036EE48A5